MSEIKYRPDIDGLRALAIGSVVLYHGELLGIRSGFVGVDIFFVISGFLIGKIIQSDVSENKFKILDFYARRFRRIMPPLLVTILLCLVIGYFYLMPNELRDMSATAMTAILGLSNISFWRHIDYFQSDADQFPLLMTWSLGVEEQFYLFFPLLLLAIQKIKANSFLYILIPIIIISFGISVYQTQYHPMTAFYLLPSRAWELGLGVLLSNQIFSNWVYLANISDGLKSVIHNIVASLGLLFVFASFFVLVKDKNFPSPSALMPALGTMALIWADRSFVNKKLLSNKILVFLGKVSYSWYLFHWPIMAFIRISNGGELSPLAAAVSLAVSLLLATGSYLFIETKFRKKTLSAKKVVLIYFTLIALVAGLALIVKKLNGFPSRLSTAALSYNKIINAGRGDCLRNFDDDSVNTSSGCISLNKNNIALIGDSHASALETGFKESAIAKNRGYAVLTKSSCISTFKVGIYKKYTDDFAQKCKSFTRNAIGFIEKNNIKEIVWVGYWNSYDANVLEDNLHIVEDLALRGYKIYFVEDVPVWRRDPMSFAISKEFFLRNLIRTNSIEKKSWEFENGEYLQGEYNNKLNAYYNKVKQIPNVEFIATQDLFCKNNTNCSYVHDGNIQYFDKSHLSHEGQIRVNLRVFEVVD
jgi:peptidoglycan/LPS O-acetylase OafA/YrhL